MVEYEYDYGFRSISYRDRETITHSLEYRLDSRFEMFLVDGDKVKVLAVNNVSSDYVLYWLSEKLRKLENGQIKVIGPSSGERKWEKEEEIKEHLWENIKTTEKLLNKLANLPEPSKADTEKGLVWNYSLICPISYKSNKNVIICTQQQEIWKKV